MVMVSRVSSDSVTCGWEDSLTRSREDASTRSSLASMFDVSDLWDSRTIPRASISHFSIGIFSRDRIKRMQETDYR